MTSLIGWRLFNCGHRLFEINVKYVRVTQKKIRKYFLVLQYKKNMLCVLILTC